MSTYSKCDDCRQTRWLVYSGRFDRETDSYAAQWRPFDRGGWDAYAPLVLSVAMARGVLKPCKCNVAKRPPWSKTFQVEDGPTGGEPVSQDVPGSSDGSPF